MTRTLSIRIAMASAKWTAKYLSFSWGIALPVALRRQRGSAGEGIEPAICLGRRLV
jgi:hypothetical protein